MARLVSSDCPNCGASIQVSSDSDTVTCAFCNTQAFVEKPNAKIRPPPGAPVVRLSKKQTRALMGGLGLYLIATIVGGAGLSLIFVVVIALAMVVAILGIMFIPR